MGTWGVGVFENDANLDWLDANFSKMSIKKLSGVISRYEKKKEKGDVEEVVFEFLAVCEILAYLRGRQGEFDLSELNSWAVKNQKKVPDLLIEKALNLLHEIPKDGRFESLWNSQDLRLQWNEVILNLERRLQSEVLSLNVIPTIPKGAVTARVGIQGRRISKRLPFGSSKVTWSDFEPIPKVSYLQLELTDFEKKKPQQALLDFLSVHTPRRLVLNHEGFTGGSSFLSDLLNSSAFSELIVTTLNIRTAVTVLESDLISHIKLLSLSLNCDLPSNDLLRKALEKLKRADALEKLNLETIDSSQFPDLSILKNLTEIALSGSFEFSQSCFPTNLSKLQLLSSKPFDKSVYENCSSLQE